MPTRATQTAPWGRRFWAHPITKIVLYFLVMLGVSIPFGLALRPALAAQVRTHPALSFVAGAVLEALCALLALWVMTRFADRRQFTSAGFALRGLVSETAAGYLIGFALMSLVIGLMGAAGVYRMEGRNTHFHALLPLLAFLGVAVAEETMFRGYVFQTLEARWGSGVALGATSVFFGLAHLLNPVKDITPPEKLFAALCIAAEAGLLLGAAYLATRRLWLPIGLHWAWNFFEGPFYGTTVSGTEGLSSLYHPHLSGPFLLTGGAFGPEAGILCLTVCTLAGLLLLRTAVRNGQWRAGTGRAAPGVENSPPEVVS